MLANEQLMKINWESPNNRVDKLFDTSLGAVYNLKIQPYFDGKDLADKQKKIAVDVLTIDFLAKNYYQQLERYIVLDFEFRLYPAIDKSENANFFLTFAFSNKNLSSIKNNRDFHTLFRLEYNKYNNLYFEPFYSVHRVDTRQKKNELTSLTANSYSIANCYHPNRIRLIIDLTKDSIYSWNINGYKQVMLKSGIDYYKNMNYNDFRSLSIFTHRIDSKDKDMKRQLIELSPVKIFTTNKLEELTLLDDCLANNLLYANYKFMDKNPEKSKNPDEIYALALSYLRGENLLKGFDLLKTATTKKHVLAMYQLGICYEYGIGVAQNYDKALASYNDAISYNYTPAIYQYITCAIKKNNNLIHAQKSDRYLFYPHLKAMLKNIDDEKNYNSLEWYYLCHILQKTKVPFPIIDNDKLLYHSIFTPYYTQDVFSEEQLNKLIANHKYPAFYLLLINYNAFLYPNVNKDVIQKVYPKKYLLKTLDDPLCNLSFAFLERMINSTDLQEFTSDESSLQYSSYYLYYILAFLAKNSSKEINSNEAFVKNFLWVNYNWDENRINIFKQNTPDEYYLLALMELHKFYEYNFQNAYANLYQNNTKSLESALKYLDIACNNNIKEAQYILGREYLLASQNSKYIDNKSHESHGIELLKKSAKAKFRPAQYLLLRYNFDKKKSLTTEDLNLLKELCELNHAPSWRLLGEAQTLQLAIESFKKAIELGDIEACQLLGNLYNKENNSQLSQQYWREFIERLNKSRYSDYYDLYIGTISNNGAYVVNGELKNNKIIPKIIKNNMSKITEYDLKIYDTF